jgi:diguanylate cyclase (GGDEF)-like protein/PAS domain S-box-containing protein
MELLSNSNLAAGNLAAGNLDELRGFLDDLPNAVFIMDLEHRILAWNRACEKLTGVPRERVIGGKRAWTAFYAERRFLLADLLIDGLIDDDIVVEDFLPQLPNGGCWLSCTAVPWLDGKGGRRGAIQILRDISYRKDIELQREESDRRLTELLADLEHRTTHDLLTGLPNRALVVDRLAQAFAQSARREMAMAVLFLDLDGFKFVNDMLGHHNGDKLLRQSSERLAACLRAGDTLGRVGGDEFIILLPGMADRATVAEVARRLIEALEAPFLLGADEALISTSIGIAMLPGDGHDPQSALKHADAAMYRAKDSGKGRFMFFNGDIGGALNERLTLKAYLKKALERQEFELHYQPKVALADGRVTSVEALMRWRHPELGMVPPGKFIPVLEETGLITQVGEWAIDEACRQHNVWRKEGFPALRVAVNLSVRQLWQPDLVGRIRRILERQKVDPAFLEIEITESLLMHNREQALEVLAQLSTMGIRLALDDFGTGYSSLSYLKKFPIHTIKIDRSFIQELDEESDDLEIVRAIVSMGHSLGRHVIAEGVEREQQRSTLLRLGCDEMQGYLQSPPLAPAELSKFLKARFSEIR